MEGERRGKPSDGARPSSHLTWKTILGLLTYCTLGYEGRLAPIYVLSMGSTFANTISYFWAFSKQILHEIENASAFKKLSVKERLNVTTDLIVQ